jgi:hypothetical protein
MKKILYILALLVVAVGIFPEDAVQPVVESVNPWLNLIWVTVVTFFAVISAAVVAAVKWGLAKAAKKLGVSLPKAADDLLEAYLLKGIAHAENWAKAQAAKPAGESKLAEALKYAVEKAGENEKLKATIDAKGKELIEKLLRSDDTVEEVTPKE